MQNSTMNNHVVIIADENGIAAVFPKVKEMLTDALDTAITVLYYSHHPHFFQKELKILERHFFTKLYVSYESTSHLVNQEMIEAVINANTIPKMNFLISGGIAFTQKSKEILAFLGIQSITIQEQFFS